MSTQTEELRPPTWVFPELDQAAAARAASRQRSLTKPYKSLGQLEAIPEQLAALQGDELPNARPVGAILFAADHPVCRHGVSAYPSEVTAAMVRNFVNGGAAASVAARTLDVALHIVDVGVAHPYDNPQGAAATIVRDPVADDTVGDLRVADALTKNTLIRALRAGCNAVDRLPSDTRVLLLGEMGIGNTTVAAALACALLDASPDLIVGRGTGVEGPQLETKRAVVRDAIARVNDRTPLGILQAVGGREVAALYGAAGRACEKGMLVIVDGFIVSTAMLALIGAHPEVRPHLLFAHRSREKGHEAVLEALHAEPLVDLSMALGEASGAFAVFPLVDLACRLHRGMATFDEASVPTKES